MVLLEKAVHLRSCNSDKLNRFLRKRKKDKKKERETRTSKPGMHGAVVKGGGAFPTLACKDTFSCSPPPLSLQVARPPRKSLDLRTIFFCPFARLLRLQSKLRPAVLTLVKYTLSVKKRSFN